MAVDQHFTVKDEDYTYSYAAGDGHLAMHVHKLDRQNGSAAYYWTGQFRDGRGLVSVYREETYTTLVFACDGRIWSRGWQRSFGDRTISRLARAFITDVQEGRLP